MIRLCRKGAYKLIETERHNKVLFLGSDTYAWEEPIGKGELVAIAHEVQVTDLTLSIGQFRLYGACSEPELSGVPHLELEIGKNSWQGFLLPTGLPKNSDARARIVPTEEVITSNSRFKHRRPVHEDFAAIG